MKIKDILSKSLILDESGRLGIINIATMIWLFKISVSVEISWPTVAAGLIISALHALRIHYGRLEEKDKITLQSHAYDELQARVSQIEAAITLSGRQMF